MLVEACAPDWRFVERFAADLESRLDEDTMLLTEKWQLRYWVRSCSEYVAWYTTAVVDFSVPLERFLDPPAVCFRPDRKDPLQQFKKYGLYFPSYDLIRSRPIPLPLGPYSRVREIDVVCVRLWSKAYQWLDRLTGNEECHGLSFVLDFGLPRKMWSVI